MQISEAKDILEIRAAMTECSPFLYNQAINNSKSLKNLSDKYFQSAKVYIAYEYEKVAGFIAFYCNDNVRKKGFISMIVVHGNYQRKGVGSILVDTAVQICKSCAMDSLQLEVDMSNLSAISFYEKKKFFKVSAITEHSLLYSMSI